jgi:hypothetical protein
VLSLVAEGGGHLVPQGLEDGSREVLGAGHRRRGGGERPELLARGRRGDGAPGVVARLGSRAERGHEQRSQLPPVGEDGGQRRPDLACAELQQAVAGGAVEGLSQPLADVLGESRRVFRRSQVSRPCGVSAGARAAAGRSVTSDAGLHARTRRFV